MMWQHKELHDSFKRANFKDSDFYSTGTIARNARKARSTTTLNNHETATLARPISSQGAERPARFKTPILDDEQRYNNTTLSTPNSVSINI